jgi:hypothetical protein
MLISEPVRHTFGFAVPNDAALDALAALSPLLEVGAGVGYWAALLRATRGADVLATDATPPDGSDALSNAFHVSAMPGARVSACDGAAAAAAHPERTLVLMYPYSPMDAAAHGAEAAQWDVRALRAYKGDTVAHVGHLGWQTPREEADAACLPPPERRLTMEEGGDTTSVPFQKLLRQRFSLVKTVPLPRWPMDADALTIWARKPGAAGQEGDADAGADADAAAADAAAPAVLPPREGVCEAGSGCACARCAAARASGDMCALPSCGARARGAAAPLLKCSGCRAAAYCDAAHQRQDWARHKQACRAAAAALAAERA